MEYADCRVFIGIDEEDEEGSWKPCLQFHSWRPDVVEALLVGFTKDNDAFHRITPLDGMPIDLEKIANGKQKVTIHIAPHDDIKKWDERTEKGANEYFLALGKKKRYYE